MYENIIPKYVEKLINRRRRLALELADVVEVVRCEDCVFSREMDKYEKQFYLDSCIGCTKLSTSYHSVIMNKNDYCSYGERKENKR